MRVIVGDCVEQMREMDEASVDAIVCDPPYGLEFMGEEWDRLGGIGGWESSIGTTGYTDGGERLLRPSYGSTRNPMCRTCRKHQRGKDSCSCESPDFDQRPADANRRMQEWHQAWATEALRVLRPGGHLLAFGGTRTYHRLACAVEDAGFEIRDSLIWIYGSGFPKSLDVSKAIDKAAGVEREVVGKNPNHRDPDTDHHERWNGAVLDPTLTAPASPEAQQWQGWGTALKPSHEPIVVARKPLSGTVAANVLEHGTGALNVDGCRVEGPPAPNAPARANHIYGSQEAPDASEERERYEMAAAGRWPANLTLSHLPECEDEACAESCPVAELDRQSGESRSTGGRGAASGLIDNDSIYGSFSGENKGCLERVLGDTGGASRFFYTAKASRSERNAGLEGFEERDGGCLEGNADMGNARKIGARPDIPVAPTRNGHPTVKPIDLMRWLVRLVTPPGGTILDPFLGSGTTGIAAHLEGFGFVGIEREDEYAEIAEARIRWWSQFPVDTDVEAALGLEATERAHRENGQVSLL